MSLTEHDRAARQAVDSADLDSPPSGSDVAGCVGGLVVIVVVGVLSLAALLGASIWVVRKIGGF